MRRECGRRQENRSPIPAQVLRPRPGFHRRKEKDLGRRQVRTLFRAGAEPADSRPQAILDRRRPASGGKNRYDSPRDEADPNDSVRLAMHETFLEEACLGESPSRDALGQIDSPWSSPSTPAGEGRPRALNSEGRPQNPDTAADPDAGARTPQKCASDSGLDGRRASKTDVWPRGTAPEVGSSKNSRPASALLLALGDKSAKSSFRGHR